MENRYLPRTLRGIFDRFSMIQILSVCSVPRTSPYLIGASLPARSRFGEGRWAVRIVLKVSYSGFSPALDGKQ